MDLNKILTTDSPEFKKLLSQQKEIIDLLSQVINTKKVNLTPTPTIQSEYLSVDEIALIIKKSRTTVHNYCREYESEIRRKEDPNDTRFELIHLKDFKKAKEKGRIKPFDRKVFNRQKVA